MKIINAIRDFFVQKEFLEIDPPLLAYRGIPESSIKPFGTIYDHPFEEQRYLYLLPSPEYYIKLLIAQGYPSCFSISKAFRNGESMGKYHSPEFTMLEYYSRPGEYRSSAELSAQLFSFIFKTLEKTESIINPLDRNLNPDITPPLEITMAEAFKRFANIELEPLVDLEKPEEAQERIRETLQTLGLHYHDYDSWETLFNRLFLNLVEPELENIDSWIFIYDYPHLIASTAKQKGDSPWAERWECYYRGIEIANCFSEERNSQKLSNLFQKELASASSDNNIPPIVPPDPGFPLAASSIKDPYSGVALGLDRLIMLFLGYERIRDVQIFPLQTSLEDE